MLGVVVARLQVAHMEDWVELQPFKKVKPIGNLSHPLDDFECSIVH